MLCSFEFQLHVYSVRYIYAHESLPTEYFGAAYVIIE